MTRPPPSFKTKFRLDDRTLLIDLGQPRRVLSSAPLGGGLVRARYVLNHQVPANPLSGQPSRQQWSDPARYLGRVAAGLGADHHSVALMTAVPLKQLVVLREERDSLWVEGFFTVGVTNAVRAGELVGPVLNRPVRHSPGTINIILVTNAYLSAPAMVGLVQVATEGKTAVLLSEGVPSWTGKPGATGTGTDAVVVVSGARGNGPMLRYSGTHTSLGELVGRLVRFGVTKGLARSQRRSQRATARHPS